MPEDECGTQFVLCEMLCPKDSVMIKLLQKAKLTFRGMVDDAARRLALLRRNTVDADTPFNALH